MTAPRELQEASRRPQDHSKRPQDGSKSAPRGLGTLQETPRALQKVSRQLRKAQDSSESFLLLTRSPALPHPLTSSHQSSQDAFREILEASARLHYNNCHDLASLGSRRRSVRARGHVRYTARARECLRPCGQGSFSRIAALAKGAQASPKAWALDPRVLLTQVGVTSRGEASQSTAPSARCATGTISAHTAGSAPSIQRPSQRTTPCAASARLAWAHGRRGASALVAAKATRGTCTTATLAPIASGPGTTTTVGHTASVPVAGARGGARPASAR